MLYFFFRIELSNCGQSFWTKSSIFLRRFSWFGTCHTFYEPLFRKATWGEQPSFMAVCCVEMQMVLTHDAKILGSKIRWAAQLRQKDDYRTHILMVHPGLIHIIHMHFYIHTHLYISMLVGGLVAIFGIFPLILGCCHHPNWLSYFSLGWPNHQPACYFECQLCSCSSGTPGDGSQAPFAIAS